MDQLYFEAGYLEVYYLTVVKEASAGFTPYFAEGYLPIGYFNYEGSSFSLSADLTRAGEDIFASGFFIINSTTTATANVIRSGAAAVTASFTQTSTITHIEVTELFAFGNAQLTAAVRRIRDNNITASAVFSVATDATRTRNTSSDDAAEFSFTANTVRSRDYASSQSAAFSLAAAIDNRTKQLSSAVTSAFAFTATISHIEGADIVANGFATLTCQVDKLKLVSAALTSSSTVSVTASRTRGITQNLSAVASVYARPKFGITWVDANGVSLPSGGTGTSGAVINNSVFKYGSGSLEIPTGATRGIVATLNANDHTIASGAGTFSISFWFRRTSSIGSREILHIGSSSNKLVLSVSSSGLSWNITQPGLDATFSTIGNLASVFGQDQWHFVELAYVQGDGISVSASKRTAGLYLNGVGRDVAQTGGNASTTEVGIPVANGQVFLKGNDTTTIYIDDYQYRVGAYYGQISVPSAQAVSTNATRTLLNLNGSFDDSISVVTHSMSADMTARATVIADVSKFKFVFAEAALASAASTSATGVRIKSSSVTLDSAFTQLADVRVIKGLTSNHASAFTQSVQAVKTASIASAFNSQATFTGTISHIHGADLVAFSNAAVTTVAVVTRSAASTQSSSATLVTVNSRTRGLLSDLTSSSSVSVQAVKTSVAAASISSSVTVVVVNSRTRDFASACVSESSTSTSNSRTRAFASSITAQVSQTASGIRTARISLALTGFASSLAAVVKVANADQNNLALVTELGVNTRVTYSAGKALTTTATIVGNAKKNVVTASSLNVVASQTAIIDNRTRSQTANVTAVSSIAVTASKFSGPLAFFTSAVTHTIDYTRIRDFDSSFYSVIAQTVQGRVTRTTSASLATASSFTATISHIEGADIVANGFATLTAIVDAGKLANAALTSAVTQSATIKRTRDVVSSQASAFTQSATADNRTRSQTAALSTAVTVACTISHIEGADLVAFSASAVTTTATKTARTTITATSAANLTASAIKFRAFNANLAASTSLIANGAKFSSSAVTLQASSSLSSNAGRLANASAAITSAMTFVVSVKEINADSLNQIVYRIPAEVFSYTIQQEVWLRTIDEETRIYTVKEE